MALTQKRARPIKERFDDKWEAVTEAGCWIWMGATHKTGYGIFTNDFKSYLAHRISYELYIEGIPMGLHVLHKCDVRMCVNPDHLFTGTDQDNMTDKVNKGRQRRGEGMPSSKLTEADVLKIRADCRPQHVVATEYSIHQSQVSCIKSKKQWGWL